MCQEAIAGGTEMETSPNSNKRLSEICMIEGYRSSMAHAHHVIQWLPPSVGLCTQSGLMKTYIFNSFSPARETYVLL